MKLIGVFIGLAFSISAFSAPTKKHECNNYEQKAAEHIALEEYGDGKVVILIHGGPGITGYMGDIVLPFCNDFRFVEYSQRDTQDSLNHGPFTVDAHIKDLDMLVDKYTTETSKPILMGQSWGATLSLLYAGTNSDKIDRVVALTPGPLTAENHADFQQTAGARLAAIDPNLVAKMVEINELLPTLIEDPVSFQQKQRELFAIITMAYNVDPKAASKMKVRDFRPLISAQTNMDLERLVAENGIVEKLKTITAPTYVVLGSYDVFRPEVIVPVLEEHIEGVETLVVPDSGHNFWLEAPGTHSRFIKEMKHYLTK